MDSNTRTILSVNPLGKVSGGSLSSIHLKLLFSFSKYCRNELKDVKLGKIP